MQIYVIHENAAWLEPLARALDAEGLPWRDWFLDRGVFDLSQPPPEGIFYNRMSASSHTRDHRYAAELTASVLAWLERYNRRVVNGSRALDLEISKARQYAALEAAGIRTPGTVIVAGKVMGNVNSSMLELQATAHLLGNVRTGSLLVGLGAIFKGQCNMGTEEAQAELQAAAQPETELVSEQPMHASSSRRRRGNEPEPAAEAAEEESAAE